MHGRKSWYSYRYADEGLKEVTKRSAAVRPEKAYVFFNSDSAMLESQEKCLTC